MTYPLYHKIKTALQPRPDVDNEDPFQ